MAKYALGTTVSVEKSKTEIERTLMRYGAKSFVHGWETGKAAVEFQIDTTRVRFLLPLPLKNELQFTHSHNGKHERSAKDAERAWEQGCRVRWRALALSIKAKLEAVDSGITSFEEEFLPHIVLPNRTTVGQWMVPQVIQALSSSKMPPMLPSGD